MSLANAITLLNKKQNLTSHVIENIFHNIFTNKYQESEIKEFLITLSQKGECKEEVLGAVRYLRKSGVQITCQKTDLIDCCGTGGDGKGSFNFSTAVAFVLAGAGCSVAKHGNRAMSSASGSADVLASLGVNLNLTPEQSVQCLNQIGIAFLFAPTFYPVLKSVAKIRQSIPHRTIFNIVGPLLNPARATRQLIGVYNQRLTRVVTEVLQDLGSESVIALHSLDGLDEISLTSDCHVSQLKEGKIGEFVFDPRESGYNYCNFEQLKGGSPIENADRLKKCLKGHSEPLDHVVHINAAWGFMAAGKVQNFLDGLLLAQDSISSGRAYQKLEHLIDLSKAF